MQTPCPFDYCNTAQVSFSLADPDPQCALNRTGLLCGKCQDELSLALGSNNCIQCRHFQYLALMVVFAAAWFGFGSSSDDLELDSLHWYHGMGSYSKPVLSR